MGHLTSKNVISIYFWANFSWWILTGYSHFYQNRWCGWVQPLWGHFRQSHFALKFPFLSSLYLGWMSWSGGGWQLSDTVLWASLVTHPPLPVFQRDSGTQWRRTPVTSDLEKKKGLQFYLQKQDSMCKKLIWVRFNINSDHRRSNSLKVLIPVGYRMLYWQKQQNLSQLKSFFNKLNVSLDCWAGSGICRFCQLKETSHAMGLAENGTMCGSVVTLH